MAEKDVPVVVEEVTDPEDLAQAQAQRARFDRNSAWLQAHATEIYTHYRGKCICIAGEELFVADTPEEALTLATTAHPEDDGRFLRYIPREKLARIYANQREWYLCDDGVVRPVIRGEILASTGFWEPAEFLIDTGADRTVFSAPLQVALRLQPIVTQHRLGGVGGVVESVVVETQIRLSREEGGKVVFRGQYAAVTELEALDMSVLGGDITGLFAVIVDRPGDVVCLLGQRHRYTIEHR